MSKAGRSQTSSFRVRPVRSRHRTWLRARWSAELKQKWCQMARKWSSMWTISICQRKILMVPSHLFSYCVNGWTTEDGSTVLRTKFSKKYKKFSSSLPWVHPEEVETKSRAEWPLSSWWSTLLSHLNCKWEEFSKIFFRINFLHKISTIK